MASRSCTYEILADPSIEMVVILTRHPTHEGLIKWHWKPENTFYTEKTMTLAPAAAKLIELAEEKHLYLGSAPDTFSRSALQTARSDRRQADQRGDIFPKHAQTAILICWRIFRFLRMPGGGICYDFSVYYRPPSSAFFGPVDRVISSVRNLAPKARQCRPGPRNTARI